MATAEPILISFPAEIALTYLGNPGHLEKAVEMVSEDHIEVHKIDECYYGFTGEEVSLDTLDSLVTLFSQGLTEDQSIEAVFTFHPAVEIPAGSSLIQLTELRRSQKRSWNLSSDFYYTSFEPAESTDGLEL